MRRIKKLENRVQKIEWDALMRSMVREGEQQGTNNLFPRLDELQEKINLPYDYLKLQVLYDPEKTCIAKRGQKKR